MTRLGGSLVSWPRSQRGPAPIVQRPRTPAFHAGNTGSNPVGGTKDGTTPDVPPWSCGAVWSARRPVKPEVAGSNPVRTANLTGSSEQVRRGRVAQLEEHSPEKRGVPGSTPGPTTTRGPPHGRASPCSWFLLTVQHTIAAHRDGHPSKGVGPSEDPTDSRQPLPRPIAPCRSGPTDATGPGA